jgi:hypothetical protein
MNNSGVLNYYQTSSSNGVLTRVPALEYITGFYPTANIVINRDRMYIAPMGTNTKIISCKWDSINNTISLCGESLIYQDYGTLAVYNNYLYYKSSVGSIKYSIINADGTLGATQTLSGFPAESYGSYWLQRIYFDNNYVYITGGGGYIRYCNVNTNGTFSNCAVTATSGENMYPSYGIVIKNGYAYIAYNDYSYGGLKYCSVNAINGSLENCAKSGNNRNINDIIIKKNYIYYINSSTFYYCPILSGGIPDSNNCNTGSGLNAGVTYGLI